MNLASFSELKTLAATNLPVMLSTRRQAGEHELMRNAQSFGVIFSLTTFSFWTCVAVSGRVGTDSNTEGQADVPPGHAFAASALPGYGASQSISAFCPLMVR